MFFKIVKTIEDGKIYLNAVPQAWEEDGTLYWPSCTTKNINKIRCNKNSIPNANWQKMKCSVERAKISDFNTALKIEESLTELTDRESEEMIRKHISKEFSYGYPAATPLSQSGTSMFSESAIEKFEVENDDITIMNENVINNSISNDGPKILLAEITNQTSIENRLDILESETSNNSAKLNKCLELLMQINSKIQSIRSYNTENFEEIDEINFPLKSVKDLERFETNLSNKNFEKKMIAEFNYGADGSRNGKSIAYKLVDRIFDRELLTLYSWTGSSTKDIPKISFSSLRKTNKLFQKIVNNADNKFTEEDSENFFKIGVLKYSMVRVTQRANKRASAPRKRKARSIDHIYLEIPNNNEDTIEVESDSLENDILSLDN